MSAVALVASGVVWRLLNTMQFLSQGLKSVCVAEMLIHVVSTKRFTPAQVQLSADSIGHATHTSLEVGKTKLPPTSFSLVCVCVCGLPWGCRLRLSSSFVYSFVSKASESFQLVKGTFAARILCSLAAPTSPSSGQLVTTQERNLFCKVKYFLLFWSSGCIFSVTNT